MSIPIKEARVRTVLLPQLGTQTIDQTALAEQTTQILRDFAFRHQSLEELTKQLTDTIFSALYTHLGPRMTLTLDSGRQIRVHMAEIPDLADSLLGVLFDSFPDSEATLSLLRDYALRATSLSAMRALLTRFSAVQSPEEQAILRRIIRDNYPPERYEDWL